MQPGDEKKKMASLQLRYISHQTSADSIHWNVSFNAFASDSALLTQTAIEQICPFSQEFYEATDDDFSWRNT